MDANPAARRICSLAERPESRASSASIFLAEVLDLLDQLHGSAVEASPDGTAWDEVRAEIVAADKRRLRLLPMRDVTERRRLIERLIAAFEDIKSLRGIIPICSSCKKFRTDDSYWQQVESFVSTHTGAEFSHGICPDFKRRLYPEEEDAPPR